MAFECHFDVNLFVIPIFNFILDMQVSAQMPSFNPLTGKFWGGNFIAAAAFWKVC